MLSIDLTLQKLVEDLYGDRRGALVAIDPATGEVLAFVSKPTFYPNLFIDGIDPQSWSALNDSPDKPLLNRPLRGTYPPGSTYKPFMALAALASGKRTPGQTISDPGYFMFGGHRFRDSRPGGHGSARSACMRWAAGWSSGSSRPGRTCRWRAGMRGSGAGSADRKLRPGLATRNETRQELPHAP